MLTYAAVFALAFCKQRADAYSLPVHRGNCKRSVTNLRAPSFRGCSWMSSRLGAGTRI